jgi:hypothetical protein
MEMTLSAYMNNLVFASAPTTDSTVSNIMNMLTSISTGITSVMGVFADFIMSNPIILIPFVVSLMGVGLMFFRQIFKMFKK